MRGILKFAPVGRKLPINAAKRPGNLGVSSNSRASQSKLPSAVRMQYSTPRCLCQPTNFRCRPSLPPWRRNGANPPRGILAARAAQRAEGRATRGRPPPGGAASPRAAAGRCAALCGAGGTRRRIAARYGGAVAPACGRLTVSPYCSSFGFCADVLSSE